MAYRRSIAVRAHQFYLQQRIGPSFSHIHRDDSDNPELQRANHISPNSEIRRYFHHQFFSKVNNSITSSGSINSFHDRRFAIYSGSISSRNFSTGTGGEDKIELLVDKVAPQLSEVAVAAADSFYPVAAVQYLIEYIHNFIGINWWSAIALTTLLIRIAQLPLNISLMKSNSKLAILKPKLESIKEDLRNSDMSPKSEGEHLERIDALYKEYGITPFTPLKGILVIGPIFCCFFLAVNNMAEKVSSFKNGGVLWFTDLMTPDDSFYVLPILTALTFWITVECNVNEGVERNSSSSDTMKKVSRAFAVVTIPVTATLPKAVFCYWITSNLFSIGYGLVMRKPEVKKYFGIPVVEQSTAVMPAIVSRNRRIPSSSVLKQRIRSLEKHLSKKKGKKR